MVFMEKGTVGRPVASLALRISPVRSEQAALNIFELLAIFFFYFTWDRYGVEARTIRGLVLLHPKILLRI